MAIRFMYNLLTNEVRALASGGRPETVRFSSGCDPDFRTGSRAHECSSRYRGSAGVYSSFRRRFRMWMSTTRSVTDTPMPQALAINWSRLSMRPRASISAASTLNSSGVISTG